MIARSKNYIEFLIYYARAKLEAESFRHFAGYLWWILDPLFGVAIYYLLFKVILHRGEDDFVQFLFIGLITWKWFADSVNKGADSILTNISLIRKIRIQKHVFPMVEVFYNTWKFLVVFAAIIIVYALMGYPVSLMHFYLIPLLLSQAILIVGLTLFTSSFIPFFPDLSFLITYCLKLAFYPAGVVFALSKVPAEYQIFIKLHPMAGLIKGFRDVIMHGAPPSFWALCYAPTIGIVVGIIGLMFINKFDKSYAKLS